MNGYKFIWKVKDDLYSSTLTSLDSDPFDIGLPSKFFLRLSSSKSQFTDINTTTNTTNNGLQQLHQLQQPQSYYQRSTFLPTEQPLTYSSYKYAITLLSFELPASYHYMILHVALYCIQINEQYAVIWNVNNDSSSIQKGDGNNNPNNYPLPQYQYRNTADTNDGMKFLKMHWKLYDPDIATYLSTTGLTFECRLNVLKISTIHKQNVYPNMMLQQRNIINIKEDDIVEDYEYEAVEYKDYDKMRFSWDIDNKQMITKLMQNQGEISFHSDIYYDLFQLRVSKKYSNTQWMIQCVGLPKQTNCIGVKWDIFAIDKKDKIQIMSQIITFSYTMAVYNFSSDQNHVLTQVLQKHKTLSLCIKANIVQKYRSKKKKTTVPNPMMPRMGTKDPYFGFTEMNLYNEQQNDKGDDDILSSISKHKIVKGDKDAFIWNITDKAMLNKLKDDGYIGDVISDAFVLFDVKYKFYIKLECTNMNMNMNMNVANTGYQQYHGSLLPSVHNNSGLIVRVHVLSLNGNTQISFTCKISMHVLQTGNTYQCFHRFANTGYMQPQTNYLSVYRSTLQKLHKLSIRVNMELIDTYNSRDFVSYSPSGIPIMHQAAMRPFGKHKEEEQKELNKEVKKWLCGTVNLPQYEALFVANGIDDMDVVKALNMDHLKSIGVYMIGHQIKIVNAIKLLQNKHC